MVGTLAFISFFAKAQKADSVFRKEKIKRTEISFLYNHYTQDGNNSAITGGIGTEKLTVVAPLLTVLHTYKRENELGIKLGVDIITSASTDKIDFVRSSASSKDARTHLDVVYVHPIKNNISISGGTGFSIESDYLSIPASLGLLIADQDGMRTYGINVQCYFDDLRWGRLNAPSFKPEKLIYPADLRNREWFNTYNRNSFNLRLALTQVINTRNVIGIYSELSYQKGLLSTPFHRVYFNDQSLRLESLPDKRLKGTLGIKVNSFVGGRTVLKNATNLYADNFSVQGIGFENETAIKITPQLVVAPSFRIYFQKGSKYFAPYQKHKLEQIYYTSDYDLSTMITRKFGVALRHKPGAAFKWLTLIELTYSAYATNNGLKAHTISCNFKGIGSGKKK